MQQSDSKQTIDVVNTHKNVVKENVSYARAQQQAAHVNTRRDQPIDNSRHSINVANKAEAGKRLINKSTEFQPTTAIPAVDTNMPKKDSRHTKVNVEDKGTPYKTKMLKMKNEVFKSDDQCKNPQYFKPAGVKGKKK